MAATSISRDMDATAAPGTIYFAYGANIDAEHMAARCPASVTLGRAVLAERRIAINDRGWATVVRDPTHEVHGVVWMLTPACEAVLDVQEDVAGGLYGKDSMTVRMADGRAVEAMLYIASSEAPGTPNPGYLERIMAWAEKWEMPDPYLGALRRL